MNSNKLILAFCLFTSVVAFAATTTPNRTADSQMQGTSNDTEITRKIRDRLTSDDSLSTAAQNVTIVTVGNFITLRGSVEKSSEISRISNVAQEYAAGKTIKNELKVMK